jgi:hypothetical protein
MGIVRANLLDWSLVVGGLSDAGKVDAASG